MGYYYFIFILYSYKKGPVGSPFGEVIRVRLWRLRPSWGLLPACFTKGSQPGILVEGNETSETKPKEGKTNCLRLLLSFSLFFFSSSSSSYHFFSFRYMFFSFFFVSPAVDSLDLAWNRWKRHLDWPENGKRFFRNPPFFEWNSTGEVETKECLRSCPWLYQNAG